MRGAECEFALGDGRVVRLRNARESDAGQLLDLLWQVHQQDSETTTADADEFRLDVDHLAGLLGAAVAHEAALWMVVEAGDALVANAHVTVPPARKFRHVGEVALVVARGWRRAGLGRALMEAVVTGARKGPLRRMTLRVFASNAPALALYDELGFVREGVRPGGVRLATDRFVDEVWYGLDVEQGSLQRSASKRATPVVRVVGPERVRALRHRILRPDQAYEKTRYPADDLPGTQHVGVFVANQPDPVGVMSVFFESRSGTDVPGWRIRGMAVDSAWQGRGLGRALVEAVLPTLWRMGSREVWCNARTSAAGFYESLGFAPVGAEFEMPGLGPHFVLVHPAP